MSAPAKKPPKKKPKSSKVLELYPWRNKVYAQITTKIQVATKQAEEENTVKKILSVVGTLFVQVSRIVISRPRGEAYFNDERDPLFCAVRVLEALTVHGGLVFNGESSKPPCKMLPPAQGPAAAMNRALNELALVVANADATGG